tara:strand:- start:461 stop:616 length:156 start_codon:yes stop_codon:yes gene_type:complete
MNNEVGWVLIYIFAFGVSDYFVKKYIKENFTYLVYYIIVGLIGAFIIIKNL